MEPLELDNAHAFYDAESRIVYVTYSGYLMAEHSTHVYNWLHDLLQEIGTETLHGEIFDFRDVDEFMPDNLMDARKKSRGLNLRINVDFPVAMIVKDLYQEEILRGPMQNVPENTRKTIVYNMEDARAFLDQWQATNTSAADADVDANAAPQSHEA